MPEVKAYDVKYPNQASPQQASSDYTTAFDASGTVEADVRHGSVEETSLAVLGLSSPIAKNMSLFETICTGWIICCSWAGVSATLGLTLTQGGPTTLVYGMILILVFVGASAGTLAELASVYPTAGGQYHWSSILAPEKWRRVLSYSCGAINVFAWISLCSGITIILPQQLLSMAIFYYPDYVPHAWHYFIVYEVMNVLIMLYNMFLLKKMLWISQVAFVFTLALFLVILITCVSRATERQSSQLVWTLFINESGWSSDGVVFLIGLISPNYMFAGLDGAIHLAEDCLNASVAVPRALMSTIIIGFITAFSFAIAMLYCISDIDDVVATRTGLPIYEIWIQATRSDTAATVFVVMLFIAAVFALIGSQQTASRLTWSFARDQGLCGSRWVGQVNARWGVPLWALAFNASMVFIIGCISLGSSAAFNAFVGCGLILQQLTYALPAALLLLKRRGSDFLPRDRYFKMPGAIGWAANIATITFALIVLIFYDFPAIIPVTGQNMNYSCAVIVGMAVAALLNWQFYARRKYQGPKFRT